MDWVGLSFNFGRFFLAALLPELGWVWVWVGVGFGFGFGFRWVGLGFGLGLGGFGWVWVGLSFNFGRFFLAALLPEFAYKSRFSRLWLSWVKF